MNKDLFAGIARVKSYLKGENGVPKLYIFEGCVNLIRELKGYFWGEGDVPKKRDDHALDELRYYLMSRPHARPASKAALRHSERQGKTCEEEKTVLRGRYATRRGNGGAPPPRARLRGGRGGEEYGFTGGGGRALEVEGDKKGRCRPSIQAAKLLLEAEEPLAALTDEQLEQEKARLLLRLREEEEGEKRGSPP